VSATPCKRNTETGDERHESGPERRAAAATATVGGSRWWCDGGRFILREDVVDKTGKDNDASCTVWPETIRERVTHVGVIDDDERIWRAGDDVRWGGPVAVH